uniref:Uncharacterized protein n=1 Tax=Heterorhabditis bacteriophora TaxID=37862 RepID=A0A1I7XGN6_HETBA
MPNCIKHAKVIKINIYIYIYI